MFKKLVNLLIATALISSVSSVGAFADTINVTVSANPDTFNPSAGETTILNVNLDAPASEVFGVVKYPNNLEYKVIKYLALTAGNHTYTWYGRALNSETGAVLEDGEYVFQVYALDATGEIAGTDSTTIEINSDVVAGSPRITNLHVDPLSFSSNANEYTTVSFDLDQTADLTVSIQRQISGTYSDVLVEEIGESDPDSYSFSWYGTDENGDIVPAGSYRVEVVAENENGTGRAVENFNVTHAQESSKITNFYLDPTGTWDPSEDEPLEINYDVAVDEVRNLKIEAKRVGGGGSVEILEDTYVEGDDYTEEWDGTDDDGDYVRSGDWNIVITADGVAVTRTIKIGYVTPTIKDYFVTKESFDPSKDETTTLVYKVSTSSIAKVEVLKGNRREITLVEDKELSKNRWYTVTWDGKDDDGDDVDEGEYQFRITLENASDDDSDYVETVDFDVEEDEVSSGKANVTGDRIEPVVLDYDDDSNLEVNYCIDEDAELFLAIYDGTTAGGKSEIELLSYKDVDSGCSSFKWNGLDKDNKKLDDGIYTYKFISKSEDNKKDNETGRFVVGTFGDPDESNDDDDDDDNDNNANRYAVNSTGDDSCSRYYRDTRNVEGTELCTAMTWATEKGIFEGYSDGSFRPYQNISRAQVLKVVLEAYDALLLPSNGTNLGFKDVDKYAWYMTYLRTAQFNGMLEGYGDGTARPGDFVTRVQMTKFALEALEAFTGKSLTNLEADTAYADVNYRSWYAKYVGAVYTYSLFDTESYRGQSYLHPDRFVQRGEVALMLYRLSEEGNL